MADKSTDRQSIAERDRNAREGREAEAVARLYKRHADAVEAVARGLTRDSHLAADVCQTVFAKAVDQYRKIPEGAERAWLLRVASNEAIDVLRKRGREKKHTQAAAVPLPLETDDAGRIAIRQERARQIRDVVGGLSDFDRQIVEGRFQRGQTFAEIAEELNKPLGTVLSRAHRLMKTLKSLLRDMNDE